LSKALFDDENLRYLINISGIVQGVGFRPNVYKEAINYNIFGWVKNSGASVEIDCTGRREDLKKFILSIIKSSPPLSKIETVRIKKLDYIYYKYFKIKESIYSSGNLKLISPDIATCPKCLTEIMDKNSKRYRYPFTNCTECGPRYSIINRLPYDRNRTSMKEFIMCVKCNEEYNNPLSRRFHTEPNCCMECGPSMYLIDRQGNKISTVDPIKETVKLLREGYIVAIKGLGGFHLACDAKNEETVSKLRNKKNRPHKPLAVMAKDISYVKKICRVNNKEEEILTGNKRPIVLLNKIEKGLLSKNISPNNKKMGVMLPYTPLHYLMFDEDIEALVMTSGNISGNPIQYVNDEAFKSLNKIADYFLMHNREIIVPMDDSVVKVINEEECVIRRARGYIPYALKIGSLEKILSLGGEEKNTICISGGGYCYLSQYIGDLDNLESYNNFKRAINHNKQILEIEPDIIVIDMHPQYKSVKYAEESELKKTKVQHHHSHMASCIGENSINEECLGVIFDGTGFGTDDAIWGSEFLVGNISEVKRAAHLKYVTIQGGDKSIKEPWRTAASFIYSLGLDPNKYLSNIEKEKIDTVRKLLNSEYNTYVSSSLGRFFDCISALLGICYEISYDGQAAIELENIINKKTEEYYFYEIIKQNGIYQIDYKHIIEGVIEDIKIKKEVSEISAKFHNTIINFTIQMLCILRIKYNINNVVLSGGVFENNYLLTNLNEKLQKLWFKVYFNKQIPINDSGISYGQLLIGGKLSNKE